MQLSIFCIVSTRLLQISIGVSYLWQMVYTRAIVDVVPDIPRYPPVMGMVMGKPRVEIHNLLLHHVCQSALSSC
jgi:hypothetical protein